MALIVQTPRLTIRTFRPDEEEAYVALFSDVQVAEHLPKRTAEENRKIFHDIIADDINGAVFSKWAVVDAATGELAGMGLLRPYNNEADKLEVGYCFHVKYWGKGIGTELTRALVTYARAYPEIKTIVAVTTDGNMASQVVLQKAGLVKQGTIVRHNEELAFFKLELS